MKINVRMFQLVSLLAGLAALYGCQMGRGVYIPGIEDNYSFEELEKHRPQNRVGTLATNPKLAFYKKSTKFGTHGYTPNASERNGMVYTCRGGHIDLAHLRNVADWTAYISSTSFKYIKNGDSKFSFQVDGEGMCYVQMEYPAVWGYLSDEGKEVVAKRIACGMGEYFAYQFGIWHEIATWYGYKSIGIYSEFESAFSWEDTYSDLLGSRLGYLALNDNRHCFSEALTLAIAGEMDNLCIQPRSVAKKAARIIRSANCKDYVPIANYKGRNFDIGLDDGYVTPWIVPSVGDCENAVAKSYPVPTLEFLDKYGFYIKFNIEPLIWEKDKVFLAAYGEDFKSKKLLDPSQQFANIMIDVEQMAMDKFGRLRFSDNFSGQTQWAAQTK